LRATLPHNSYLVPFPAAVAIVTTLPFLQFDVVVSGYTILRVSEVTSPGLISTTFTCVALFICAFFFREVPRAHLQAKKVLAATESGKIKEMQPAVGGFTSPIPLCIVPLMFRSVVVSFFTCLFFSA
jgi:hypothetical protein